MPVLIGGNPSGGSTLLAELLNRHPDVFCGNELNFFNKEEILKNFGLNRAKISSPLSKKKLMTSGWDASPGHNLDEKEYRSLVSDFDILINKAKNAREFVDLFYERILCASGARVWVEKTPSNTYGFHDFLAMYPEDGKVIHIIRNPYDSVTSFFKRRGSYIKAAAHYLYNNACGLNFINNENYLMVRYEDLVLRPGYVLSVAFAHLNVPCSDSHIDEILQGGEESGRVTRNRLRSWDCDATEKVKKEKGEVGSNYRKLTDQQQEKIHSALSCIYVSRSHQKRRNLKHATLASICKDAGYDFSPSFSMKYVVPFWVELQKNKIRKSFKKPANYFDYPVAVAWLKGL